MISQAKYNYTMDTTGLSFHLCANAYERLTNKEQKHGFNKLKETNINFHGK